MQGNLEDMGVADLIQHACQDGKTARLRLEGPQGPAEIYMQAGQVVHASDAAGSGEEVVYRALQRAEGSFQLEPEVISPERSIERSLTSLLLEGVRLADERGAALESKIGDLAFGSGPATIVEGEMSAIVDALGRLDGVSGVVVVAEDGVVLGHQMEGDPEKEGAVAAFIGAAAAQVGETMSLGEFKRAQATIGGNNILVFKHREYFAGLALAESASPALVASRAETTLQELG
jgi:predicted regulator of Ras-like GTPase activity (Roadblock/LC7/MglB family)